MYFLTQIEYNGVVQPHTVDCSTRLVYRVRSVRRCTLWRWVKWRLSAVQTTVSCLLHSMRAACLERLGTCSFVCHYCSKIFVWNVLHSRCRTNWTKLGWISQSLSDDNVLSVDLCCAVCWHSLEATDEQPMSVPRDFLSCSYYQKLTSRKQWGNIQTYRRYSKRKPSKLDRFLSLHVA